jgi:hypothetical protein
MQLADPAHAAVLHQHLGGTPRMQERAGSGPHLQPQAGSAEQRLDKALGGEEVGRDGRPPPRGRRGLGDQAGKVMALGGGDPPGWAALRRREVAVRLVDVRRLEQPQRRGPMGGVVTRGVEQPGQQQRPHHGLVLAKRVRQPQGRQAV